MNLRRNRREKERERGREIKREREKWERKREEMKGKVRCAYVEKEKLQLFFASIHYCHAFSLFLFFFLQHVTQSTL